MLPPSASTRRYGQCRCPTSRSLVGSGGFGGSDGTSQIAAWVEENFTAQTVGSYTVYDLSQTSGRNATTDTTDTVST